MINYLPAVSALVTLLVTAIILYGKFGNNFQDIPNDRSLHVSPTPRIGGVGIMAGVLSAWVLMFNTAMWWLILPMLGLFIVSLLDDLRSLPVRLRLTVHFAAAALMVAGAGLLQQGMLVTLLILLLTAWMTNLYNFMDGADGLAGGMAVIGFSIYGIAALMVHNELIATLNFSIAAAAAVFLCFNFYPAKIFMGDSGSIPLGFLVAAMGSWGWLNQLWPAWFPILVFSPFVADSTVTLFKRTLRGEKIQQAHRDHYYQRLLMLGIGHRNTALIEYVLMLTAGSAALWSLLHPASISFVLLTSCVVYALAMLLVESMWKAQRHV